MKEILCSPFPSKTVTSVYFFMAQNIFPTFTPDDSDAETPKDETAPQVSPKQNARERLLEILSSPRHLAKVAEKARRHAAIVASLPFDD
jgi:galactose-1-phosphate uridylyltransferase